MECGAEGDEDYQSLRCINSIERTYKLFAVIWCVDTFHTALQIDIGIACAEDTAYQRCLEQHENEEVEEKKAIPILSIYFLGYPLEHFHIPVIRVQRDCYNDATNEKLEGSEEFIEGLTHDSYIIQVPYLRDDLKTELEKMLSIFDQSKISSNHHILNIKEEDYPEKYRPIIRRLQHAAAESVVRDQMDIEDEITDELNNMSRVIEQQKEILIEAEVALKEKDKALEGKDKQIRELLKRLESTS